MLENIGKCRNHQHSHQNIVCQQLLKVKKVMCRMSADGQQLKQWLKLKMKSVLDVPAGKHQWAKHLHMKNKLINNFQNILQQLRHLHIEVEEGLLFVKTLLEVEALRRLSQPVEL